MNVAVKQDNAPKFFEYGIPFEFYDKLSSYYCKQDGSLLDVSIFVRNDIILPAFFLRAVLTKDFKQGQTFQLTCSFTALVDNFTNKYTSLFTTD